MPSYLGSKVHPSPVGTLAATLASIGSMLSTVARDGAGARVLLADLRRGERARPALASCARTLPESVAPAISSMVRPETTDVVIPATISEPASASASRCLISSHWDRSGVP